MAAVVLATFFILNAVGVRTVSLRRDAGNQTVNIQELQPSNVTVKYYCQNKRQLCVHDTGGVCGARTNASGQYEERTFENHCVLLLTNLCGEPGQEFYISWYTDCEARSRRSESTVHGFNVTASQDGATRTQNGTTGTQNGTSVRNDSTIENRSTMGNGSSYNNDTSNSLNESGALRAGAASPYKTKNAADGHKCPLYCPETTDPVCVQLNRLQGMYFMYNVFRNHCLGDMYYCKYYEKIMQVKNPTKSKPDVRNSKLSYSQCAHFTFMTFSSFSETMSSLAHFGWLEGPYRASHILTPRERHQLGTK